MYQADEKRYEEMKYNRCGASGLQLPAVSLGLWHNFGSNGNFDNMQDMCHTAFDHGITHFDLANNYGPVPGSAEENFVRTLNCLLYSTSASVRTAILTMVLSASTGYLPAAVSPESMIALVP